MKTAEKLGWLGGGIALTIGTAFSIANDRDPQVFDKTKPAIIKSVSEDYQGPGQYINGVFYADNVIPAHITAKQCPEQNSVLTECVTDSFNIPNELVGNFVVDQTILVESIIG